jgi:hypothetical protein
MITLLLKKGGEEIKLSDGYRTWIRTEKNGNTEDVIPFSLSAGFHWFLYKCISLCKHYKSIICIFTKS